MAEFAFARLTPSVPIAQASIAVSGGADSNVAVADDLTTHHSLAGAWLPDGVAPPPEPAPPTETALRASLATALAVERAEQQHLRRVQEQAERAALHLAIADSGLRSFDGLDAEAARDTIAQLCDPDRARVELADDFNERIAAREQARINHAVAIRAQEHFASELGEAQASLKSATATADRLVAQILVFSAEQIADERAALLAQAELKLVELFSFNMWAAGKITTLPINVRVALGNDTSTLARQRDKSEWIARAAALRADPQLED